jgi:hypothetical protein
MSLANTIWLLASLGNLLILSGLVKRRAWHTLPLIAFLQAVWIGLIIMQDLTHSNNYQALTLTQWRMAYYSWLFADRLGIPLYVMMCFALLKYRLIRGGSNPLLVDGNPEELRRVCWIRGYSTHAADSQAVGRNHC